MAVAIRQRVAKAGRPATEEVLRYERRFFAAASLEARAWLDEFIGRVAAGTWEERDTTLRAGDLVAFGRLTEALDAGWAWVHDEVMARLRVRAAKAAPAETLDFEASQYGMPHAFRDQYTKRRTIPLAGNWTRDRLQWTQAEVVKGLDLGESIPELQDRLREGFPQFSDARLQNIARTEANTLYSHGKYARQQASVYVAGWEFYNPDDERTSAICEVRIGVRWYKPDEPEIPPLHHQCRSELLSQFEDEPRRESPLPPGADKPLPGFGAPPVTRGFQERLGRVTPIRVPRRRRKPRPKPRARAPRISPRPANPVMLTTRMQQLLTEKFGTQSQWSGIIRGAPKADMGNASGFKEWNCDIVVRDNVLTSVEELLGMNRAQWDALSDGERSIYANRVNTLLHELTHGVGPVGDRFTSFDYEDAVKRWLEESVTAAASETLTPEVFREILGLELPHAARPLASYEDMQVSLASALTKPTQRIPRSHPMLDVPDETLYDLAYKTPRQDRAAKLAKLMKQNYPSMAELSDEVATLEVFNWGDEIASWHRQQSRRLARGK